MEPAIFFGIVLSSIVVLCAIINAIYDKISVDSPALIIKMYFSKFSIPKDRLTEKVSMLANIAIIGKVFAGKSSFSFEISNCRPIKNNTSVEMLLDHWRKKFANHCPN